MLKQTRNNSTNQYLLIRYYLKLYSFKATLVQSLQRTTDNEQPLWSGEGESSPNDILKLNGLLQQQRKLFCQTKDPATLQPSSPHSLNHNRKPLINLYFIYFFSTLDTPRSHEAQKTSSSLHTIFGIHTCLSISHPLQCKTILRLFQ